MASYVSGKMKRKDLDEVYDDFSDLSLSAPATKIRRLDAELPLIVDKLEPFTTSVLGKQLPEEEMCRAVLDGRSGLTEAVSPSTLNEERALVMYKPPDAHLAPSYKINPKLITSLKSKYIRDPSPDYTFWPRNPNMVVEEEYEEDKHSSTNKCLAVVPWVPSHVPVTRQAMEVLASGNELVVEPMEAEGTSYAFMEIEGDNEESGNAGVGAHGNQQWQQHCMTPQFLQNNSTIMWS